MPCQFFSKMFNAVSRPREYLVRFLGPDSGMKFQNIEGHSEYFFSINRINRRSGISALIRCKNESRRIPNCLESIYDHFDEIVIIENNSSDDTRNKIDKFIEKRDSENKISVHEYPFHLSRNGPENAETTENSIHSPVYMCNFGISKCRRSHIFKWDADMLLPRSSNLSVLKSLHGYWPTYWNVPIQTIYVRSETEVYEAIGEINEERRIFPNRSDLRFVNSGPWEGMGVFFSPQYRRLEGILIYEIKDVREDEFAHWSTDEFPTERKQREQKNFNLVKSGNSDRNSFRKMSPSDLHDVYF